MAHVFECIAEFVTAPNYEAGTSSCYTDKETDGELQQLSPELFWDDRKQSKYAYQSGQVTQRAA